MKEILQQWNPWWDVGTISQQKTKKERTAIIQSLKPLLKPREILALQGVRRSGKSTIMYQLIAYLLENGILPENILYFNFDEPLPEKNITVLEKVYRTYIELQNPKGRLYLLFDEIQGIPRWEEWIKKYYDLRGKEIKCIITGSNSTMLSSHLSKLLTGRMLTKELYPLSFSEFLQFSEITINNQTTKKEEIKHALGQYIRKGGFPEVVLENDKDINRQRLKQYFDSVVLRDIVSSHSIREPAKLTELGQFAMTNIASLFSYNKISYTTGINIHSLKEYLSYFEQAYLIFQLRFFSYSIKESLMIQKQRKLFCIDTGMRNAVGFTFSKDEGKLAENSVFVELKRRGKEIFYWKQKNEVDFIVKEKDNSLIAINVCYSDSIPERETKGLHECKKKLGKRVKECIIITRDKEKKEDNILYIPLWKWLLDEVLDAKN